MHSYNIVRQLQVYLIEQRTHVGKQYRFPHFKVVNWYALTTLLPLAKKRLCGASNASNAGSNGSSGGGGDDGSDSDEDEDLINMCDTIGKDCVFRQFPYLVRACADWLPGLDGDESEAFFQASREAWCADAQVARIQAPI